MQRASPGNSRRVEIKKYQEFKNGKLGGVGGGGPESNLCPVEPALVRALKYCLSFLKLSSFPASKSYSGVTLAKMSLSMAESLLARVVASPLLQTTGRAR